MRPYNDRLLTGVKTLREFSVKGKRLLIRCDFNVPLDERGNILDDFRIKQTLPTINYLVREKAKIILMSHLGKPKGEIVENLKLDRIQKRLSEYLILSIKKTDDCLGEEVEEETKKMKEGEILLLENLRFHKEEEEGDSEFAKSLANLGDIFINEAFATCHRPHASIVGVPKFLPSGAGFLLEKEIESLNKIIENPKKPLVAIFGGDDPDFPLVNKISEAADWVLIGELIGREIEKNNMELIHPPKIIKPVDGIDGGKDVGSKTIKIFREKILQAKTIFWSGPIGKIEEKIYQKGTIEIAQAIIKSGAFSVIGGGETVEFINKLGLTEKFNHLSTGGSAMLAFLAGEKLPGIEILKGKHQKNFFT